MSLRNKVYKGDLYKFTLGKQIGKGGNGRVFEVNILNPQCTERCVVKILSIDKWRDKKMKELRYKRFHKEIHTVLEFQNDLSGIMKVLDFHCPDEMQEKCEVWYLMYKA
jgi:serine/threonine protein kinase